MRPLLFALLMLLAVVVGGCPPPEQGERPGETRRRVNPVVRPNATIRRGPASQPTRSKPQQLKFEIGQAVRIIGTDQIGVITGIPEFVDENYHVYLIMDGGLYGINIRELDLETTAK